MQKGLIITTLISLLAIIGLVLLNQSAQLTPSSGFQEWKSTYSIKYQTPLENQFRKIIFIRNVEKVRVHNSNPSRTYDMGINQFAALTEEQFTALYMRDIDIEQMKNGKSRAIYIQLPKVDDIDWVSQGAVARVKSMGQCNANWAFAATGALQGLSKISYGTLRTFSDQQLLDCSGSLCSCQGGFVDMAFRYIQSHGLCQQSAYPYQQVKQSCRSAPECTFKISDYDFVDNCKSLEKAIGLKPIAVAVDGTNWPLYKSGIFSNCGTKVNYMALLVGVVEGNWKLKNSFGPTWGQDGFIRLAPGNTCGICGIGLYPIK